MSKDKIVCAWWSANGERLGTYNGHQGAIWTVDVSPNTVLLATGSADNTVRLWNVRSGECVKVWEFPTAVKRVEFTPDGSRLLAVTEKRMGFLGTIVAIDIRYGEDFKDQVEEPSLRITCQESKATVAGWSYLGKYILAGHEDGSVSQYDPKVGQLGIHLGYLRIGTFAYVDNGVFRAVNNWQLSRHTNLIIRSTIFNFPLTAPTLSRRPRIRLPRYVYICLDLHSLFLT